MYTMEHVKAVFPKVAAILNANVDELARLDGQSGDGDLGASMASAGQAMTEASNLATGEDIGAMLLKVAMACNKAAPSTMGTLLSSGIMTIAKATKGKTGLEDSDVAGFPHLFAEGIVARGNAKVGDKTILDALVPMADTVEQMFASGSSLREAYFAGAEAARLGAESTCGMLAKVGRAHWIGERAKEHMDGGAALCAMLAKGLVE